MKGTGLGYCAIALLSSTSGACAETVPHHHPIARCQVVDGENLLVSSGGVAALCDAIDRAAAARGLKQDFTVKVRVSPRLDTYCDCHIGQRFDPARGSHGGNGPRHHHVCARTVRRRRCRLHWRCGAVNRLELEFSFRDVIAELAKIGILNA